MAALFFDSFDHYVTANLPFKWTALGISPGGSLAISAGNGRRSTQSLRAAAGGSTTKALYLTPSNPAPSGDTFICGFAFTHRTNSFAALYVGTDGNPESNSNAGLVFVREGTTTHVFFRADTDGKISAYNGNGTLLGTSSSALVQDVTSYLEFKVVIHNSAGTVDVVKDGVNILSLTSKDTQNGGTATWNTVAIAHLSASTTVNWDYDDFYLLDGTGSAPHNTFLGDVRVDATYPNAAGNSSAWTRSTGADQWATIDEALYNSDTDYNETATLNALDTLNFPNAPVAGADILAVQVNLVARKADAGNSGISPVVRISGVDNVGTEIAVPSSYGCLRTVWALTPEGSPQAWTDSIYNAAEFGYKKTS